MQAIQLAIEIRRAVNTHPLISKYFRVLDVERHGPGRVPRSRASRATPTAAPPGRMRLRAFREDEFILDPTRLTLVCGTAGYDGTQFKGLLAAEYEIQLNKTSRNSVLLQTNINNTRSDVAQSAQGAGRDLARRSSERLQERRRRGAHGVRGAGEVADGGRARTCRTSATSTTASATTRRARRSKATCARRSTWPTTTTAASTSS